MAFASLSKEATAPTTDLVAGVCPRMAAWMKDSRVNAVMKPCRMHFSTRYTQNTDQRIRTLTSAISKLIQSVAFYRRKKRREGSKISKLFLGAGFVAWGGGAPA